MKIRNGLTHGIHLLDIIYKLYDFILVMYLFSHMALRWDYRFQKVRHIITFVLLILSFRFFLIKIIDRRERFKSDRVYLWGLWYILSCAISCIGSPAFDSSIRNVLSLCMGVFLVFAVHERYCNRNDLWTLLNCMVLSAVLSGLFILYESGFAISYGRLGNTENSGNIVNILSVYCSFGATINVAFLLKYFIDKRKIHLAIYIFYELVLIYTVLRTGSRTGTIILTIGTLLSLYMYWGTKGRIMYVFLAFSVFMLTSKKIFESQMFRTMYRNGFKNLFMFLKMRQNVNDGSIEIRAEMMITGLRQWLENPLLGRGVGSFIELEKFGFYSHSDYIELLYGIGLIGTLIFYSLLFIGINKLCKYKKKGDSLACVSLTMGWLLMIAAIGSVSYTSVSTLIYMVFIYKMGEIKKGEYKTILYNDGAKR